MFNKEERNPVKWILWGIIGVVIGAVLALFFGLVVMWLWNWLMPTIFGLPTLTYWQAWGLVILFHILFKGGHHGHDHHSSCSPKEHFAKNWKKKFHEKMDDNFSEAEIKEDPDHN
ncbi:MAG: hypothetical protein JXQ65_09930 [Candidatus Marinimicrobia bacterium]|nr:hypothetical protein [Candidatus Neomarinimicrobiota bacterium]